MKGRGGRLYKGFIAVFVCMATRAAHLEVITGADTAAFLAALKRFTARRGLCRHLRSDNGTNFVGGHRELRDFERAVFRSGSPVTQFCSTEGIQWHFNPPSAPHFGGLWEAGVNCVKHHLRRVLGEQHLTFEEFSTLLASVEACLNSRPLQALSDDPDDFNFLTPGHFLVGGPLLAVPEPALEDVSFSRLSRWQLVSRLQQDFWRRWSREYLQSLQPRGKWSQPGVNIRVGDLCFVLSENLPPTRWPIARVVQLHPGADGITRVVTLRTATTTLTRPATKLVLLPAAGTGVPAKQMQAS